MKQTFTRLMTIAGLCLALHGAAQTTETFETYTLSSQGYYQDTTGTDWQDAQAIFRYDWNTTYGYWSGGSAYTNMNDTTHGDYSHIYNCRAGKGYNNSNNYVTSHPDAIIKLKSPYNQVTGFYVTNTTYAYKSIRNGDSFARKFGDTTGTHNGGTIAQGSYPDWFKLLVHGYRSGAMIADSVEFYLADYRFTDNAQDYIVQNWQWVDCTSLGAVDSISYDLKSSDVGQYGMNTPAYFSLDNFTTGFTVGIHELPGISGLSLYPNPAGNTVSLQYAGREEGMMNAKIYDMLGNVVASQQQNILAGMNTCSFDLSALNAGVYVMEISSGNTAQKIKFVKQ